MFDQIAKKYMPHKWVTCVLTLLAFSGLAAPASALEMMVWDSQLQTKLAYGESENGVLRGQVVRGVADDVIILFSKSDLERGRAQFAPLRARYEGEIRGGQIMIKVPGGLQTLEQFLMPYRLKLSLTETSGGR